MKSTKLVSSKGPGIRQWSPEVNSNYDFKKNSHGFWGTFVLYRQVLLVKDLGRWTIISGSYCHNSTKTKTTQLGVLGISLMSF